MIPGHKLIKVAALLILISAAFDLCIVDFVQPTFCDEASTGNSKPSSSDDCFCCCAHVLLVGTIHFEPTDRVITTESLSPLSVTSAEPTGIYHPPRI
jgi:hypothetical protein